MADRIEKMMENQKKREEQMKEKERKQREDEAAARAASAPKPTPGKPSAASGASDKPVNLENYIKLKKHLYAPLPKTERGKPVLLGGDPSGENILYCNGSDVIIRSLRNPINAEIYSEHPRSTTVARYSPNRRWIASGDETGTVRIWNTEMIQGTQFKLHLEKKCFGGVISDIAWDSESNRLVAVGNGREVMGVVFFVEGGASAGTISGHSKTITSCDIRPNKPYRIVTCSEDLSLNWFEGPPFKWHHTLSGEHSRYPNCVRFSPKGDLFVSVGQDKVILIGDGETGQKKSNVGEQDGHNGGIYSVSWSSEGNRFLTSSGDRTCKIWDVTGGKAVTTFTFGDNDIEDQQVGCLWQGDFLISVNLAGHLSYLDHRSGKVEKVIQGHQKGIQSVGYHESSKSLYSGGYDSVTSRFVEGNGEGKRLRGDGHKNSVTAIGVSGDDLHTASMDDTYRHTKAGSDEFSGAAVALGSRPLAMGVGPGGLVVTGQFNQSLLVLRGGKVVGTTKTSYNPQSIGISHDGSRVAVGGDDNKVHLYSISSGDLKEAGEITGHRYPVTAVAYSHDGKYLATGDKNNQIYLWNASDNKNVHNTKWVYHSARINSLRWSPNSQFLASCALDTSVIIWRLDDPDKRLHIKAAHHGAVNDVQWLDNSTVASVGSDASLRTWNIQW